MELGIALAFFVAAALFVFVNLSIGRLLRPANPSADKAVPYECGERPVTPARIQFNPRFYVVALVFLLFEVEIALVFPVASVFREHLERGAGVLAALELSVFLVLLWLGLVYVWIRGDLDWVPRAEDKA